MNLIGILELIHRDKITFIVVENFELMSNRYAYECALNIIDHLITYHIIETRLYKPEDYKWKYVLNLTDEDITSCETEYALIVKIGTFFNTSLFLKQLDPQYSLIGHILDRGKDYYELDKQCFIVRVKDYDCVSKKTVRNIKRSADNFHDNYTPVSIADGGFDEEIRGKLRYGGNLISNLLSKNCKVSPFNIEIRKDKSYIYPHDSSSWLRSCINRPFILFPISTDKDINPLKKFENIVGPCNGLQILKYLHTDIKSLHLYDLHLDAIDFTSDIIWKWDWRTQSLSNLLKKYIKPHTYVYQSDKNIDDYCLEIVEQNPHLFETLKKIRKGEIIVEIAQKDMLDINTYPHARNKPNTLIQFSNILSYSPTFYSLSAIDADLIFLKILQEMNNDSVFLGMVPFRGWREFTKKDISINHKLNLPWRQDSYEGYYKSRVRALQ